ncbi:restriction endonuclease subunit S [Acidithiobacillus concretivorus]|uniref:Restriction endonuclease subunit S n=1 Tax=Acidithiobacillus concretivorus TaxID=3063952 RepID=A0ABS5ZNR3_9PROT|nr:restriction endonuclease subunit S [Acidithiobacillus concretivorus]MBU2738294.1 restriction endonuclease subunit S [Acidithiobacillus concretivorus]
MVGDWTSSELGELTINFDGKRKPVKESNRRPGPYPYYGASGIVDYVDGYLFEGDYLLIAEDGENLRTRQTPIAFIARGKFWVNNHAHIVVGNENADTRFLMYALHNADTDEYLTGAVMPKLTQGNLNRIEISHPCLAEQRRIAHILGTLDDKIENNRKTAKTLEAMAQAIFQSWFVDFDPVRAKMAGESKESICKRLKLTPEILGLFPDRLADSELGEIPEGWEVKPLESVANFLNGLAMQKFPSYGLEDDLSVIKIAQLRIGNLIGADQASREIEPKYIVHDGDILFSWSGSLECVLWSGGTGALNQHLFKVTPKLNYPRWLCYFGIHHHLSYFREIAAGKATTMGHIQRHHLSDAVLTLPSIMNLEVISKPVQALFETVWKKHVESQKLSGIRDMLLPKLISGELRVPAAQDLVEDSLL